MGLRSDGKIKILNNLYLNYLTGTAGDSGQPTDRIIKGTERLIKKEMDKHGTINVSINYLPALNGPDSFKKDLEWFAANHEGPTRVYIRGHGDWAIRRIGSLSAAQVCQTLQPLKPIKSSLVLFSVTGCNLAKSPIDANGFAKDFHLRLANETTGLGLKTIVFARKNAVWVRKSGIKVPVAGDESKPETLTVLDHKDLDDKIVYYWHDGRSVSCEAAFASFMAFDV